MDASDTHDTRPPMIKSLLVAGLGNIAAGARLASFLPVQHGAFRLGPHQAAGLLLFAILFEVAVGFVLTEPSREFYLYGLTDRALYYLVILLGAYLVTALQRRVDTMSHFVIVMLSAYPLVVIAMTLGDSWVAAAEDDDAERRLWILGVSLAMWIGAIVFRAVRLLDTVRAGWALLLAVVFLTVNFAARSIFPPQPLWFSRSDEAEPEQVSLPISVEDTYYAQSRLLGSKIRDLAPGRPGVTDLYFLGFGSYAEADVFMKEVFYVKELFDRRFDTQDRSLVLVNNPATVDDVPLATTHNLTRALERVAAQMNVDEDILFLFLTSHGSRDHRLMVEFWPLSPNDLPAEELQAILDRVGIRWRVIVVSACYSGGFIDALKDDSSLIITASRDDRSSFGCAHENELTYFGRAYFDERLSIERSFSRAFEGARDVIARREIEQELTPSLPQMYIGTRIRPKLDELEQRLSRDTD